MSDLVLAFRATAGGEVRKCQHFSAAADCVSCGEDAFHPVQILDETFVERTCVGCGFVWKQFH